MMKAATGLPSDVLLPAVALLVHVVAGLAAGGLVSSLASRQGDARLVFLQRQGCPAGGTTGGHRGRPHLSVSRAWDYLRIVLKRKIELPPVHLCPADEGRIVEARYSDEFVGFGGARDFDGRLSFAPRLPNARNQFGFSLRFGGRQIRVRLTHDEKCYLVDNGAPLNVLVRGEPRLLSPRTAVAIKLPPP
jgi:hypothetical protein